MTVASSRQLALYCMYIQLPVGVKDMKRTYNNGR